MIIITRNQIVFKSSFLSFSAILYLVVFMLSLVMFLQSRDWDYLLVVIFAGLLVSQFLPYEKQVSLKDIRKVKLESVRGVFTTGSLLSVNLKNKVLNIVPAQLLSQDIMQLISSKNKD